MAPLKIDGPDYLPAPELPDPVDIDSTIDPREFRLNGMPNPATPPSPGFCSATGSGLPCDPRHRSAERRAWRWPSARRRGTPLKVASSM